MKALAVDILSDEMRAWTQEECAAPPSRRRLQDGHAATGLLRWSRIISSITITTSRQASNARISS